MPEIESALFDLLVRKRKLPHPTARNFDPGPWGTALRAIENPSTRDQQLAAAAVFYGSQFASLRSAFESRIFEGMDRRSSIALSVAMANYNFIIFSEMAKVQSRKAFKDDDVHLGFASRQAIESSYPGNRASPDAMIATLVDTLPHCIERASKRPSGTALPTDYWTQGKRLFSTMSVEHSLRDLWQQILWDGWVVSSGPKGLEHRPTDVA